MRLALTTDLISRDGSVDQDAKLLNCFVEDGYVVKRPAVNSDLVDVTGVGQGGIANNSLAYVIFGDVLKSYNSSFVIQDNITL